MMSWNMKELIWISVGFIGEIKEGDEGISYGDDTIYP